jgi:BON domain-containing protein
MTAIALRTSTLCWEDSDSELERRIANFLHHRHVPGGERIRLVAHEGVVAVSGQISTRSAKWLCIECCRRVAGVLRVIDQVKIQPAVNTQPVEDPIRKQIESRRERRFDDAATDGDPTIIPFPARKAGKRRNLAASNRPTLLAAA